MCKRYYHLYICTARNREEGVGRCRGCESHHSRLRNWNDLLQGKTYQNRPFDKEGSYAAALAKQGYFIAPISLGNVDHYGWEVERCDAADRSGQDCPQEQCVKMVVPSLPHQHKYQHQNVPEVGVWPLLCRACEAWKKSLRGEALRVVERDHARPSFEHDRDDLAEARDPFYLEEEHPDLSPRPKASCWPRR